MHNDGVYVSLDVFPRWIVTLIPWTENEIKLSITNGKKNNDDVDC